MYSNISKEISVLILTWNSEKHIKKCIESLLDELNDFNKLYKIFIIDGGSQDLTLKILDEFSTKNHNIKIIKLEKNYGTTISRNIGIRKSVGKYILILDSDTEVKAGMVKILIDTINKEDKVGIVAPRLFYPDGSIQSSCKRFPTIKTKIYKYMPFHTTRNIAEKDELYDEICEKGNKQCTEVDYCISAAWMVNREAINAIGFFDENIFYAPEDVDYCLRMWLKGWKVIYNPFANVLHHTQRKSYKDFKIAWHHLKGLLYYFGKYNYWFDREKIYERIKNQ
jgi:GT2 family glycosyltransferase